jgi:hypothetical protein
MNGSVETVIFTCTGREHLLQQTWDFFGPVVSGNEKRRILAVDGTISTSIVGVINPTVLVQNSDRRGYIHSILNALALVDAEFFIWLEDDWKINTQIEIPNLVATLQENPKWVQIRWSKSAPLKQEDLQIAPGLHVSSDGFSANPCICRTALVKAGLEYLRLAPKGGTLGQDGFENVLTRWCKQENLVCAVLNPGNTPQISHLGYLESTGREWHMTSSLEKLPCSHLPVSGVPAPMWRRIWMLAKLFRAFTTIAIKQFFGNEAYDLAFRIMASAKDLGSRETFKTNPDS